VLNWPLIYIPILSKKCWQIKIFIHFLTRGG